jgi:hypothetical protein
MSWFMNPFVKQIDLNWLLGDRHHIPKFSVPPNHGRGEEIVTVWEQGPYDLSGTDAAGDDTNILNIVYAKRERKNWSLLSINITSLAASDSAVTPTEIASALNADSLFPEIFSAELTSFDTKTKGNIRDRLSIRQKQPVTQFWFYILPGQAEEVLQFNYKAGVAEAPVYFERHQLNIDDTSRFDFSDCINSLFLLDTVGDASHQLVATNARDQYGKLLGFDGSTVQEDWKLLEGKSGIFQFTSGPSAGPVSSTTTQIIYSTGAKVGDLAMKIVTQLDAGGDVVAKFEMPHTLDASDLITPP